MRTEAEISNKIDDCEYLIGHENGNRYEEGYNEGFQAALKWVLEEEQS